MKEPILLIIDDNYDSRLAMRAVLRKNKYTFFETHNAKDGLLLLNKIIPDLILLDLKMPDMSGYEVLKLIKANEETKHIPVLIVTAFGSMQEKITALEYGANGLFSKPFDRVHFAQHVETLMGMKQSESESPM